jgi:hypothetical protein
MEKLLSSTAETEMSLDAFKLMAIVPSQQNTPTPGKLPPCTRMEWEIALGEVLQITLQISAEIVTVR